MRPLLFVAECPPRHRSGGIRPPLDGPSGQRLARLCGLTHGDFLQRQHCVNLLDWLPEDGARWPTFEAAERAHELFLDRGAQEWSWLFLGNRVARAFAVTPHPYLIWRVDGNLVEMIYCVVPHPSGRNRWFNDSINRASAERFLRWITKPASNGMGPNQKRAMG